MTKEEKISIISAVELNETEKRQVKHALESNPENEGKTFIIDYSVNEAIIGGLQMYTENKFMDLSLSSRLDKIRDEVNKMIQDQLYKHITDKKVRVLGSPMPMSSEEIDWVNSVDFKFEYDFGWYEQKVHNITSRFDGDALETMLTKVLHQEVDFEQVDCL